MLSTITWCLILLVILILKYSILNPIQDKEVYKLYEQRDKIALMAMDKELDQDSKEYLFVVKYLNFWVYYTRNNYDFSIVLRNIMQDESPLTIKRTNNLFKKIRKSEELSTAMVVASRQGERALGLSGKFFENIFMNAVIGVLTIALGVAVAAQSIVNLGMQVSNALGSVLDESRKMKSGYNSFSKLTNYWQ